MIIKRLLSLLRHRARKEQYYLELGSYFIRKGTGYKIGQPFEIKQRNRKKAHNHTFKTKQFYISNLFFNFKENKVTYKLSTNHDLNRVEEEG